MAGLLDAQLNLPMLDKSIKQSLVMLAQFEKRAQVAIGVTLEKASKQGSAALDGIAKSGKRAAGGQDLVSKAIANTTPRIQKLEAQLARLRRVQDPVTKGSNEYKRAVQQTSRAIEKLRIQSNGGLRVQRKIEAAYKSSLTPMKRLQQRLSEINKLMASATSSEDRRTLSMARANTIKKIAAKRELELTRRGRSLTMMMRQQTSVIVGQLAPGFAGLGAQLGALGPAAVAAGVALVAGLGLKKSAGAAMDFNFALAELQNKMGLAGDKSAEAAAQLRAVEKAAIDAGLATKFSATEAVGGLQNLVTMGFNTRQSIEALGPTLNFATSLNLEIGEAAKIAAASMNVFAHESTSLEERLGILNAVTKVSAIQQGDLLTALSKASRGAGLASQSMSEMLVMMQAGKDAGQEMEEVGTGIANGLLFMAAKSKDGQIQIGKMAIQLSDASGKFRKFGDIMLDVAEATKDMSEPARAAALKNTFGVRTITPLVNGMLKLKSGIEGANGEILKGADALAFMRKELENTADAVNKDQQNLVNTTKGTMEIISGQWDTLFVLMGQKSDGFFNGLAKAASKSLSILLDVVRVTEDELDRTLSEAEIRRELTAAASGRGEKGFISRSDVMAERERRVAAKRAREEDARLLAEANEEAKKYAKGLNLGALSADGLAASIELAMDKAKKGTKKASDGVDGLSKSWQKMLDLMRNGVQGTTVVNDPLNVYASADAMAELVQRSNDFARSLPAIQRPLSTISNDVTNMGDQLRALHESVREAQESAPTKWEIVADEIGKVADGLTRASLAVQEMGTGVGLSALTLDIGGVLDAFAVGIPKALERLQEFGKQAGGLLKRYLSDEMRAALEKFGKHAEKILNFLGTTASTALGVASGVVAGIDTVLQKFGGVSLAGLIFGEDGAGGISKALAGFESMLRQLPRTFERLFNDGMLLDLVTKILDGVVAALPEILPDLVAFLGEASLALVNALPKALEALADSGLGNLVGGILTALTDNLPEIVGFLAEIAGQLVAAIIINLPSIIGAVIRAIPTLVAGLFRGLRDGFEGFLASVKDKIVAFFRNIIDLILPGDQSGEGRRARRRSTDEFYNDATSAGAAATTGDAGGVWQRGGSGDPFRRMAENTAVMSRFVDMENRRLDVEERRTRALEQFAGVMVSGGIAAQIAG